MIAYRQVDPRKAPPDARAHASWKQVLHHAHERAGIFEYLRRNYKKAAEHFDASQRLKPITTYGDTPYQGMARLAERIRLGDEIVPAYILFDKGSRPKLVLLLASLYLGGWRDKKALALFQRVANGEFKEASINQRAYARMKEAEAYSNLEQDKKAVTALKHFDKTPYANTPAAAEALLHCSVVLARMRKDAEADKYMVKCYTDYPNTEIGQYALYQMAFIHFMRGEYKLSLAKFTYFAKAYPDSPYVRLGHAHRFIKAVRKRIKNRARKKTAKARSDI
jgi:tetratricopeptide (TPR) repeat protein